MRKIVFRIWRVAVVFLCLFFVLIILFILPLLINNEQPNPDTCTGYLDVDECPRNRNVIDSTDYKAVYGDSHSPLPLNN